MTMIIVLNQDIMGAIIEDEHVVIDAEDEINMDPFAIKAFLISEKNRLKRSAGGPIDDKYK